VDVQTLLVSVLYTLLIVLAGFAIWGIREIVTTARSVRRLTDELGETLPPLIERANVTLSSVDSELLRVNGVVSQIEEVSDRVQATSRAAAEMVEAPAAVVSNLADGARRFLNVLFRS
jgi:methyl-accepting chemotaxis protein